MLPFPAAKCSRCAFQAAARAQQWDRLDQLEARLGENAPVWADLDFYRVPAKLPDASPERVWDYARRYPDTPLTGKLRRRALARYGESKRWSSIRTLTDSAPRGTASRCHYHRAWLDQRPEASSQAGLRLSRSGYSRPDACTPLFKALKNRGKLNDEQVWQRLLLAFRAGNPGLVRYLADRREDASVSRSDLQRLYDQPARIAHEELPGKLSPEPGQALAADVIYRLADQDPSAARSLLDSPRARSSAGARGLMQLMPATARRTAQQLNDPVPRAPTLLHADTSIRLGAAHLARLLDRYNGHRLKALAAYNAGSHHLEPWLPERRFPLMPGSSPFPFTNPVTMYRRCWLIA